MLASFLASERRLPRPAPLPQELGDLPHADAADFDRQRECVSSPPSRRSCANLCWHMHAWFTASKSCTPLLRPS